MLRPLLIVVMVTLQTFGIPQAHASNTLAGFLLKTGKQGVYYQGVSPDKKLWKSSGYTAACKTITYQTSELQNPAGLASLTANAQIILTCSQSAPCLLNKSNAQSTDCFFQGAHAITPHQPQPVPPAVTTADNPVATTTRNLNARTHRQVPVAPLADDYLSFNKNTAFSNLKYTNKTFVSNGITYVVAHNAPTNLSVGVPFLGSSGKCLMNGMEMSGGVCMAQMPANTVFTATCISATCSFNRTQSTAPNNPREKFHALVGTFSIKTPTLTTIPVTLLSRGNLSNGGAQYTVYEVKSEDGKSIFLPLPQCTNCGEMENHLKSGWILSRKDWTLSCKDPRGCSLTPQPAGHYQYNGTFQVNLPAYSWEVPASR